MNADWFYSVGDNREGPVTEDDLKGLVSAGRLQPTDLVWKDGMKDWVEARTIPILFPPPKVEPLPDDDRPVRRRFDDDGRPSRRGRDDFDDDRPSRRGRRPDDDDPDDDRPKVGRRNDRFDDRDDYDDRPRRGRSKQRPGQVQAVAIMMLVGGILGLINSLVFGLVAASTIVCCLYPGLYYGLVVSILLLIRGINMLNQDDQGPPRTLAILQIICIVNADVVNCVLGIVSLVMLNDPKVEDYYRRRGFV